MSARRTGDLLLTHEKVCLRVLTPDDLEFLYAWENAPEVWAFGDTEAPYSRETLRLFIENQRLGFHANGQLRLVICRSGGGKCAENSPVGMLDFFDFDHADMSAGVGILICDPADRRKGYAREALEIALSYAKKELGLRRITCTISPDNTPSLALFARADFKKAGARVGELLLEKSIE